MNGFTLVELMVVVAIIGILSTVAIPNFKRYQAKAKTSEAKLELSALYTAETSFMADYDTFASCLNTMGLTPPARGYYSYGFHQNWPVANSYAVVAGADAACNSVTNSYALSPTTRVIVGGTQAVTSDLSSVTTNATSSAFTGAAVGKVSADNAFMDVWYINENKMLTNQKSGI